MEKHKKIKFLSPREKSFRRGKTEVKDRTVKVIEQF